MSEPCDCGEMAAHRHIGIVELTETVLWEMFVAGVTDRWYRVVEGLPFDAKFLSAYFSPERRAYRFFYESPAFPACLEGVEVEHVVEVIHAELNLEGLPREAEAKGRRCSHD